MRTLIFFFFIVVSTNVFAQSDSTYLVKEHVEKRIPLYNEKGQKKLETIYLWDNRLQNWVDTLKKEYFYQNQQTIDISSQWNTATHTWINNLKYQSDYDSLNNLRQELIYQWVDSAKIWLNQWKTQYSYTLDNKLLSTTRYQWESSYDKWDKYSKTVYNYDKNGKLLFNIDYQWDFYKSDWLEHGKCEYSYTNKGLVKRENYYLWISARHKWNSSFKIKNEYQEDNLVEKTYYRNKGIQITSWKKTMREIYTYNSQGKKIVRKNFFWYGEWVHEGNQKFFYDAHQQMVYVLQDKWNNISKKWQQSFNNWISVNVTADYKKDFLDNPFLLVYPSVGLQNSNTILHVLDIPNSTKGEWKFATSPDSEYSSFSPKETDKTLKINNLADIFIIYECDYKGKHYRSNTIVVAPEKF